MKIKSAESCDYDILCLGEIMLRLDPGHGRVRTARHFDVWEGGGEYNVARGLRKCFGMRAAVVTALVDNEVGHLIEDFVMQGGVDTSHIMWLPHDGLGRTVRNGLNFTERGFGVRGGVGCVDRGNTAASKMMAGDVDWDHLFGEHGVRWFHTGGIFAGISATAPDVIAEALQCARKHGTVTSYDLNYRESLWRDFGGLERCQEVNRELAKHVDVMIGNEGHFAACLDLQDDESGQDTSQSLIDRLRKIVDRAIKEYPNLEAIAMTLRGVKSASVNDWGATCWHDGNIHQALHLTDLAIFDRIGGGDSFASGLVFGFMSTGDAETAVNYGVAHGALAMTTPGDTSMATRDEVEALMAGESAKVKR